jgi:prolyl-tRNA editing enzyme YbaK/EbsC (Cys-tRNA(Pro) deacylase)
MEVEELTLKQLTDMLVGRIGPGAVRVDGQTFMDDDVAEYIRERREKLDVSQVADAMGDDKFRMSYDEEGRL